MRLTLLILVISLVSCGAPSQEKYQLKGSKDIAVELVGDVDSIFLGEISDRYNLKVYRWKDHIVLFGDFDLEQVNAEVADNYPGLSVKTYTDLAYSFLKTERCGDSLVSVEWKDYLLTANLVADLAYQQEYLDYHSTQFEEWPEVADGFCNADFQRLFVYKSGRQLLLVISVPADKTLDELNPKTVENNPRMDEWNALMAKYQEGIPGTSEGEVWVFLNPM